MNAILVESHDIDLFPFSSLHLNYELRIGAFTLIERLLNNDIQVVDYQSDNKLLKNNFIYKYEVDNIESEPLLVFKDNLLINNALLSFVKNFINSNVNTSILFYYNDIEYLSYKTLYQDSIIVELPKKPTEIKYLWDAIDLNERLINEDFVQFGATFQKSKWLKNQVVCVGYPHIHIAKNVKIEPFVSLNTENGPIIIDENAKIMSHSTIIGPCFIGKNSVIKAGAKIYGNTSIGQYCKVGGEVEGTIFQGYSNKQHDGFLGHSFVGEWVNLGADTNTSDLKNTYGNIRVEFPEKKFDSGRMFLGTLFGDHVKTGINTMLNSGTTIGMAANVFGADFPPKCVPAFSFGGKVDSPVADLERTLKTAETVMQRRNVKMSDIEKEIFRNEYLKQKSRD